MSSVSVSSPGVTEAGKDVVVLLVTSIPSTTIIEGNQHSLRNILKGHHINQWTEVDGSQMDQREERNKLFGISGRRGNYPQIFVRTVVPETMTRRSRDETEFLGGWDKLEQLNESRGIDGKILEEHPEIETLDQLLAVVRLKPR